MFKFRGRMEMRRSARSCAPVRRRLSYWSCSSFSRRSRELPEPFWPAAFAVSAIGGSSIDDTSSASEMCGAERIATLFIEGLQHRLDRLRPRVVEVPRAGFAQGVTVTA